MKYVFYIFGFLVFAIAALFFMVAKSALHEIEAFILFLISVVLIVGACVIAAIEKLKS